MAIATQEKGIHSTEIDPGGGVGLMQMQYAVWVNQDVKAYNFDTSSWETFHVTDSNIRELDTNIKIACMYFRIVWLIWIIMYQQHFVHIIGELLVLRIS